ncbi:MAG: hypothetical protein Kow0020_06190 [Wenzhouxiangellaceae bacterium]
MVGLAAAFSNFAQAQEFSSLEERMTGEEFRAAGLEKLSPDELAALNEWIRAHSLATLDEARELRDRPGELPPIDRMAREPFRTRIKGPFSGWNKDTEFVLENGMVWVPTEDRNFYMPETDSPYVIIRPGALGTWLLNVEGYNQSVRVKRIK